MEIAEAAAPDRAVAGNAVADSDAALTVNALLGS